MSSWEAKINTHAAKVAALRHTIGHLDGIVGKFTRPRFAYALAPLRASPKQIREADHLMLSQGYCYLRLFAVKYHRQIAQWLGKLPTYERVEQQLRTHRAFPRGDSFVTAYISGPFQAHIAKSRKENPFHLGTLRRLNEGMPIRIGAERSPSLAQPATSKEVVLVDVSIIPMSSTSSKLRATRHVPANQMTTVQHQVIQEVWNSIQLARASTKMNTDDLEALKERFENLTEQLNIEYRKVTEDMTGGMTYLHQNLHGLATQASQFSGLVHQQLARTAEGEEKIVALQVANKSNNDNLEILAQIVQAEAKKRNEHDSHLETWARKKNQEVLGLKSDTTLTKGQVARLQEQLREEQGYRLNNQANHDKDIARLEEWIIKAIEGAASLEKAKEAISVNLMQARASSASTTAEIRAGIAKLGKKKQRPTVAALFSQEEEFLRAQWERLEALKGTAGGSGGTPPLPPGGRANPDPSDPEDEDDDEDGSAPSRRRGGAPSRSPSPPRHFHRPTPEEIAQAKREEMQTFPEIIAMALAAQPKEDDTGKRLPFKSPDTYDGSLVKFRRWWESIDKYFAIHRKRVPTDETKIYSVGTFLRDQAADWYMERKRTMKTLHLEDNWKAFSMAIEELFTDRQEQGKGVTAVTFRLQ